MSMNGSILSVGRIFLKFMTKNVAMRLTAGLLCSGVGLIRGSGTVGLSVTHFHHWYAQSRAGASPLTGVTVSRVTI